MNVLRRKKVAYGETSIMWLPKIVNMEGFNSTQFAVADRT